MEYLVSTHKRVRAVCKECHATVIFWLEALLYCLMDLPQPTGLRVCSRDVACGCVHDPNYRTLPESARDLGLVQG